MSAPADQDLMRANCSGVSPLSGRLEAWQTQLLEEPETLNALIAEHGSPVNILDPGPMAHNAGELQAAADEHRLDLKILFARKANKALCFVDEARRLGLGIDLASEVELRQVLDRGVSGEHLMMTAAVKPAALLSLCLVSGTTIAIDNHDELRLLVELAASSGREPVVALRLAPDLGPGRAQTRFGFSTAEAIAVAREAPIKISGLHFHLDGYSPEDRVLALGQCIGVVDAARAAGHDVGFIDMGGGIPMSYLEDESQWSAFWDAHEEVTFDRHTISKVYPYHQSLVRGDWLRAVLSEVAEDLRSRDLQLRCEPGRSLLDGCGMTVARVEFRKQRRDGTWLIGTAMNRTQCRSTSDDFMVDPLLVPAGGDPGPERIEGYLVGAYCIERELLTWRRLRFPSGVAVGDLIVFPNTAGYLMHILESSSHQIPLATNLVVRAGSSPVVDDIDT